MMGPQRNRRLAAVAMSGLIVAAGGCTTTPPTVDVPAGYAAVADLHVVDCELPDRVMRVGNAVYLKPRPPIRTTAADCRTRGGEYVAYDRSNYQTALNVWLPAAEAGDPAAQVNVGEIYERGPGGTPNYEEAARWYERAAAAGNDRATFNLAVLYEKGLGVPQNRLRALNLYRQVWGVTEDDLIFRSLADAEIAAERSRLEQQIREKNSQIEFLRRQLSEDGEDADAEAGRQLLESLEEAVDADLRALDDLPPPPDDPKPPEGLSDRELVERFRQMPIGDYHALIIGNQNYHTLEDLSSPHSDAESVRRILETRYGFDVKIVDDADRGTLMVTIAELRESLEENDNLLIYYAGHGACSGRGGDGAYWLPVDADPPPDYSDWVATTYVSEHLEILQARRVLVVADSCFASPDSAPEDSMLQARVDPAQLALKRANNKSRLMLSSGHDRPVAAVDDREHSLFALALLAELEDNQTVLTGPDLFARLRERLRKSDDAGASLLNPQFAPIQFKGHAGGDFFFVPLNP